MKWKEYYSVLKRNELSSHERTWRKLKCTLLSEWNQSEKAISSKIPIIWHSGEGKTMETVKISVGHGLWERGINKWSTENFHDSDIPYDVIIIGILSCFLGGSDCKEYACNMGDPGLIPASGRSPREGNGYLLQYSCLENSKDIGMWWATAYGVTKSLEGLSD